MNLSVEDVIDIVNVAMDGLEVGNPGSSLTPQELEQIASICARKQVTIDPQSLQDAVDDWNAQNQPAPPAPVQHAPNSMAGVVGREPAAQPQPTAPEFNPARGRRTAFDEQLDAILGGCDD